jgi:drug/metabolite transporter (DMT)-like permease
MNTLIVGLVAALCWGIHDVIVRKISQTAPLMATLLGVLVVGGIFQLIMLLATGGYSPLPSDSLYFSLAAGAAYLMGAAALYGAFHRGPVKIVAPIIGGFPILSVATASIRGEYISNWQWAAVLVVVLAIAVVAIFSRDDDDEMPALGPTILLSAIASFGFFAAFALGQEAAKLGSEQTSVLVTRATCILLLLPVFVLFPIPIWAGKSAVKTIIVMGILDGIALYSVLSAGGMESPHFASVAASTFGLVTVILAWAFLREKMTSIQWVGCALAFAAIGALSI